MRRYGGTNELGPTEPGRGAQGVGIGGAKYDVGPCGVEHS